MSLTLFTNLLSGFVQILENCLRLVTKGKQFQTIISNVRRLLICSCNPLLNCYVCNSLNPERCIPDLIVFVILYLLHSTWLLRVLDFYFVIKILSVVSDLMLNVQNQNQIKHVKKTNKNVKPVVERVLSFDIKMNSSGVFYHFITKCCR